MYGYDLKRVIDSEFARYWRIDFAQLYRSLAKLHAQGFVDVHAVTGEFGPERKQYQITPEGRTVLEAWLSKAAASEDEFWVKLRLLTGLGYDPHALVRAEREREETERLKQTQNSRLSAAPQRYAGMDSAGMPLRFAGSDDALLARLAHDTNALSQVIGSTAGLVALAQDEADVVGLHLREPEANEYNISFVQHLVAEQDIMLVNLAVREYGLVVARGNPKQVRSVRDLTRGQVRLLNRSRGAGSRLWLQRLLRTARIDPSTLRDWSRSTGTYAGIANAILADEADVGPGLRVTAERAGLDFIPLGEERFDLAIPRPVYESRRGKKMREILHGKEFRNYARTLPGYDLSGSGRVITEIKFGQRRK